MLARLKIGAETAVLNAATALSLRSLLRNRSGKRMLIIDEHLPDPRKGAGYPRARKIVEAVLANDWQVDIFAVKAGRYESAKLRGELFPAHIMKSVNDTASSFVRSNYNRYDVILISRPTNMKALSTTVQEIDRAGTCIIYDAEAIFAERAAARRRLDGDEENAKFDADLKDELALVGNADIVISVSQRDASVFKTACSKVFVVSTTSKAKNFPQAISRRKDIIFVGRIEGASTSSPNVDSLSWFIQEVMPLLDQRIGSEYRLKVVGFVRSPEIEVLASDRIILLGVVDDVEPLYAESRAFVAPTRFAAGVPLKVIEAAAYGIPCVATPLLMSQTGFKDGEEALSGDTPEAFAKACATLMTDDDVWLSIRSKAFAAVERLYSEEAFTRSVTDMLHEATSFHSVR